MTVEHCAITFSFVFCFQNGWASPSVAENPTDLSHAVPSPGLNPHHDCSGTDGLVNNVNQARTNFIAYQNFGGYYGTTDEIYQQHSDKLYDLGVNIYCTRCHDHNPLLITNCSEY